MKLKHLLFAVIAGAASVLGACNKVDDVTSQEPKVSLSEKALSFSKDVDTKTFTLTATRDWEIKCNETWVSFEPASGKASAKEQTVTVTVLANTGFDRTAKVTVKAGLATASLTVNQAGDKGEVVKGDGTQAKPFSASDAREYTLALAADQETEDYFFIHGFVKKVASIDTGSYGNGSFYLVNTPDDMESTDDFYCFQVFYLNGAKFTDAEQIKVGDEVTVQARLVNYKGNTPETVGKGTGRVVEHNGAKGSIIEKGEAGTAKGTGTEADPYNATAAIEACKALGADKESATEVYIKGYVKTASIATNYGNADFDIVDEKDGNTTAFKVYRVYDFGGAKFTDANKVKAGDEIVVLAKIVNYKGNTPETVQGGKLVSINGEKGEELPAGTPKGTGTEADPYNATGAIKACEALGADVQSTTEFYIKGFVKTASIAVDFGNADFDIVDEKDGKTATFKVYRVYDFDGEKFTDANKVKVGDEIVVLAKIVNYKGNTPETVQGGKLISINGKGGEPAPFTLDKTSLSFAYTGGEQTITVSGAASTVTATSSDSFLTVTVSGSAIKVVCAANSDAPARNGSVTVALGDYSKTVAVSQEKDPGYAPGGGAQDGETKYELTNAEIIAACKPASGSGYATLTINSAGGNWTANAMTNANGAQVFLQMRNAAGSFASSPKYNGTITRVVISVKVSASAKTSNPRSIYVVPKVDANALLSAYPTKDNKYTLDTMNGNYGKIDFDLMNLTSTPESFEVKFTDTNVSEFSLLAYNGAVYIDNVVVYVK